MSDRTFPLVPRWRVLGVPFGGLPSVRRGGGHDVVGSRAYVPGDPIDRIDWAASARLSSARNSDDFVVREREAEEAPRIVAILDRRASMRLNDQPLPWLSKPDTVLAACRVIEASASRVRAFVGLLDHGGPEHDVFWQPPKGRPDPDLLTSRLREARFDAPDDTIERCFDHLALVHAEVPAGTFVFVLSDFLAPPSEAVWALASEHRWDVVPVVVQDPVFEQSFPRLPAVVLPVAGAGGGMARAIRFRRRDCERLRQENEARLAGLLETFAAFGLEPVVLGTADPDAIADAFLSWASARAAR
jgi:uncharacterized protein (DUF58 family)